MGSGAFAVGGGRCAGDDVVRGRAVVAGVAWAGAVDDDAGAVAEGCAAEVVVVVVGVGDTVVVRPAGASALVAGATGNSRARARRPRKSASGTPRTSTPPAASNAAVWDLRMGGDAP